MTNDELQRLGRHVAERQDVRLETSSPSESTRRFLAEYSARRLAPDGDAGPAGARRARPTGRRWLQLSLAALLAVGLFALKEAVFWKPALSFSVGSPAESGVLRDWESAPDDARLPIRFSDGSLIELQPKARARVVAVGRAGAEIVIESGRAHVSVVPVRFRVPGEEPWRVSLGPFSVEVKGTRFDVGWDPRTDEFALDLFEGTVEVSGCADGRSHTLVAGQGVRASCSKRQWTLVSSTGRAGPEAPEVAEPSPATAAPTDVAPVEARPRGAVDAGPEPLQRPPSRVRGAPRSWQALARAGHYAAAYERALAAGFEAECERVSAKDLALLGDTARLEGDVARARAAYLAVRRRFEHGASAAQAAFALGRLAVASDPKAAQQWFERYLREAPDGPLAPAAHDWVFELAGASVSPARRRDVARNYLDHHPRGAHAEDARRILDANDDR